MAKHQDASTGQISEVNQPETDKKAPAGQPTIALKVYSPFKTYFDEQAFSLSATNATGPFDVLPEHHDFISLLIPSVLHVIALSGERRIKISGGLLHVHHNQVNVFLDV